MRLGIVGLPNVGKSTLIQRYYKGRSRRGQLSVLHHRAGRMESVTVSGRDALKVLHDMYNSKGTSLHHHRVLRHCQALVRGAAKGEGLGNKFLGHISAKLAP